MIGNVTALEGLHVTGKYREQVCGLGSHMQTLIIYKLGFNQNYYKFTLIFRYRPKGGFRGV